MPEQIPLNSHDLSAAGIGSSLAGQGGYSRALTPRENLGSAKMHFSLTPCLFLGLMALIPQQNHQNPTWKMLSALTPHGSPMAAFPLSQNIQGQIHQQHPHPPTESPADLCH